MTLFPALQAARNAAPFGADEFHDDIIGRTLRMEAHHQTRPARRMILLCLLAILAFLVWAMLTPIHEAVTGRGTLMPADGLRKVQHLEGGIVESVVVRPGDWVEAGDVLVRLDREQLRLEHDKGQARMAQLDLSISRLRALAGGNDGPLTGDTQALWESQSNALAGAQAYYQTQIRRIAAQRAALDGQLPALARQRAATAQELAFVKDLLNERP